MTVNWFIVTSLNVISAFVRLRGTLILPWQRPKPTEVDLNVVFVWGVPYLGLGARELGQDVDRRGSVHTVTQLLDLSREDEVTIVFCGSEKSRSRSADDLSAEMAHP
jgi:hypothetical protein